MVLNFHFRGPKKQRVPRWMRKYIIGYLGKAFCFCYESKKFNQKRVFKKSDMISYKKGASLSRFSGSADENTGIIVKDNYVNNLITDIKENESFDENYLNNQTEPAYIKYSIYRQNNSKLNKGNSDKSIDIKFPIDCEANEFNKIESNQNLKKLSNKCRSQSSTINASFVEPEIHKNSNSVYKDKPQSNDLILFNEDISKNLEKTLIKMQKTFDPFKLQDDNLKFAILKEILECQRLLLTANLSHNKEKKISINEIYDEWKILAMIVDRICFFVYLSALVVSSGLFFLSEQIYDNES